jgi:Protein of unknown function (DUF3431)
MSTNSSQPAASLEIVIAHYNEDLTWLHPYASQVTIYSKGKTPPTNSFNRTLSLPNIGRETHTYLTHIVRTYDSLPSLILFLQGNIHDTNNGTPEHTSQPLSEIISLATSTLSDTQTLPIGRTHFFSDWDGIKYLPSWIQRRGQTLKRTPLSPAQFWERIFHEPHPAAVRFAQGALFAATRGAIRRRPKKFYVDLLRYFEELGEVNPEEGHFMERFWFAVLDERAVVRDKDVGDGEGEGIIQSEAIAVKGKMLESRSEKTEKRRRSRVAKPVVSVMVNGDGDGSDALGIEDL